MKIAIIGSRDYENYTEMYNYIKSKININDISKVVSGGARGADAMGEWFAKENNIKTEIYLPDWNKYGRGAGFVRNKQIIENAEIIFAFLKNNSNGTKNSIMIARKLNRQLFVLNIK